MCATRVFETVVEDIAASIRSGELPEGERLPSERDLVLRYGASRTSIREALLSLQAMGLIEITDRSRARVRTATSEPLLDPLTAAAHSVLATLDGVKEFQDARLLFECGLARYAAEYASPKEIERLGLALLDNRRSLGKPDQFLATDTAFHAVLASIPNNSIFIGLNAALAEWLSPHRRAGIRKRGSARTAYQHHERVFEAIASRSPAAADAAMSDHLSFVTRISAGSAPMD